MSSEERERRRVRNDQTELFITAGLLLTMAVLVLVGIWMVSRVPPPMQTMAQGVFATTIVLGFGQVLLLVKSKLVHKDVAADLDATVKVAEKVDGGQTQALEAMGSEHSTSLDALRKEHEAALAALREEHQRERHKEVQQWNADKLGRALAESELKERSVALAKSEAAVRDLTEKLARCAETKKADA